MIKGLPVLFAILATALAVAAPASGQSVLQVSVSANGASSDVPPGGSVALTANGVGQAVLATVTVRNTGASSATITALSVAGTSALAVAGTPTLPVTILPNGITSFLVQYLPSTGSGITGQVSIGFTESSQPSVFTFTVNGNTPDLAFTFFALPNSALASLNTGDRITFPATNLGSSATAVVNILNRGSAAASLQSVAVTGIDYQVTDSTAPVAVPVGQQVSFNVVFTPHAVVTSSGLLTVALNSGSASFFLAGSGSSPNLAVFYTLADNNVHPLPDGTVINVPSVDINRSTTVTIDISNQGTGAGTVTGISLAGAGFQLTGLPPLPLTIGAGQSSRLGIVFSPSQPGNYTGIFRINLGGSSVSGTLVASTTPQPAALPGYQFQGPAGNPQPAQQPVFGLTLASPYPLALQGTLTLTFVSTVFTDDPSIQFASGGRTVNFKIPANSTQALFNGNATSMALQTGTTAGNIVITPAFALPGGFDLTPSSPDVLTLTIQPSAPQLLSAGVTAQTLSSFTLVLSGYSTTRAIRQLDIQITPRQGQSFSTTHLTIDVSSASSAWSQSAASQGFGGSFLMAIPFNLSNGNTTADLVHLLQSLSITATNDVGASSAVSVTIP
jgi:hypothetical protein